LSAVQLKEPTKLQKQLIHYKYTEHLVHENENKLRVQKKKKAQAETDLSEAVTLREAAIEKGRQQKEELAQQMQMEEMMKLDNLSKVEAKEDELKKMQFNFELSQSGTEEAILVELENKKKLEDNLKQLEKDIDHYTNHQDEEMEIIKQKIQSVKEDQEKAKSEANKIKKEYNQVEKKIAAIIETMDPKDVQEVETRLEMEKLNIIAPRPVSTGESKPQNLGIEIVTGAKAAPNNSKGNSKPTTKR